MSVVKTRKLLREQREPKLPRKAVFAFRGSLGRARGKRSVLTERSWKTSLKHKKSERFQRNVRIFCVAVLNSLNGDEGECILLRMKMNMGVFKTTSVS